MYVRVTCIPLVVGLEKFIICDLVLNKNDHTLQEDENKLVPEPIVALSLYLA